VTPWLRARARELEALRHYRASQVTGRVASRIRRRLTAAAPARLRAEIDALTRVPPPVRETTCPPALRAFALHPAVVSPSVPAEILEGRFTFLGEARPYLASTWRARGPGAPSHLWRMNLHYHRFLLESAAGALRAPARAGALLERAAAWVEDWMRACPAGELRGFEDAWNSYAVSTRILHGWAARRLLQDVPGHAAECLRRRLDGRGAADAAFLSRWLEHDLQGNHLLRNAVALAAAGRWFAGPRAERWGRSGEALLARELHRQLLEDGFHEERSPMYHALLVQDLLLLGPRGEMERERTAAALRALRPVVHPDGDIALLNDSALAIAPPLAPLRELGSGLGLDLGGRVRDLPAAGYFGLGSGDDLAIFDAGLLGPDHLPAHAHCDALSFEMSLRGRRVVTDTGVDRYEAGPERDFQRSTAAHATLQVDGREQGEPFGSFRMGRRPRVRGRRLDDRTVMGEHDGFGASGVHRRTARWEGGALSWHDELLGAETAATVRVGLAPGARAAADGQGAASVQLPDGTRLRWTTPEGALAVESGVCCRGFGEREPRAVLCWRGRAGAGRVLAFRLRPA
jgi:uncharacterized heparinase superfamily protein